MDRKYFTEPQTITMHITDGGVVLLQFKLLAEERRQLTHRDTGQPHELLEASWGSLHSIFTAVSSSPIMELACLRKEPNPLGLCDQSQVPAQIGPLSAEKG